MFSIYTGNHRLDPSQETKDVTGVQAVEPGSIQAETVSLLLAGALANAAAGVIQFYDRPALLENIVAALHHNPQHNGA